MTGRLMAGGIDLKASPRQPAGGTRGIAPSAALPKPPQPAPGGWTVGGGTATPASAVWPAPGPGHITGADAFANLFMAPLLSGPKRYGMHAYITPFARDLVRRLGRCGLQPITSDGFQPLAIMVAITYWFRHPHANTVVVVTPRLSSTSGLMIYKSWLIGTPTDELSDE